MHHLMVSSDSVEITPSFGASRHLLPAGERRLAAPSQVSSPLRGEVGRAQRRPGEGAYATPAFAIAAESSADIPAREALLDRAMGPRRRKKSSEKLRRGRVPAEGLAFVAKDVDGRIVGTVRLWDVVAGEGGTRALLLGPLAVDRLVKRSGIGSALMRHAITEATRLGHSAILLVGDAPYYARFGFSADKTARLAMPGPHERERFLALELAEGALDGAEGVLGPTGRKVVAELVKRAA